MKSDILIEFINSTNTRKIESNNFIVKTQDSKYESILKTIIQDNNCFLRIAKVDLDIFFKMTKYPIKNRLSSEIVFLESNIKIDDLINNLLYIGGWLLFDSIYKLEQIKKILNKSDFILRDYPLSNKLLEKYKIKYGTSFLIASFWDDCEWNVVL